MFRLLFLVLLGVAAVMYVRTDGFGGKVPIPEFLAALKPMPELREVRDMSAAERSDAFAELQDRVGEDPRTQPMAYVDYLLDKEVVDTKLEAAEYMKLLAGGTLDNAFKALSDLGGLLGGKNGDK